jgi:hypothetical protein
MIETITMGWRIQGFNHGKDTGNVGGGNARSRWSLSNDCTCVVRSPDGKTVRRPDVHVAPVVRILPGEKAVVVAAVPINGPDTNHSFEFTWDEPARAPPIVMPEVVAIIPSASNNEDPLIIRLRDSLTQNTSAREEGGPKESLTEPLAFITAAHINHIGPTANLRSDVETIRKEGDVPFGKHYLHERFSTSSRRTGSSVAVVRKGGRCPVDRCAMPGTRTAVTA